MKRPRVLAGIDPNAILPSPRASFEDGDDPLAKHGASEGAAGITRHVTRSIRHLRQPVNYDMKLHPMDRVPKPRYAAKRLSRCQSRSASMKTAEEDGAGATEESGPSNVGSTNDIREDDAVPHRDAERDEMQLPLERLQNSAATRHSTRGAALKFVNHSNQYHPQDFGISGHRSKGQAFAQALHHPQPSTSALKRKILAPSGTQSGENSREDTVQIIHDHDETSDNKSDQDEDPDPDAERTWLQPRKALKTTSSSSPTATRARARRNKQGSSHAATHRDRADPVADEDPVYPAARLIAASQMPNGQSSNLCKP